jgi:hypothetical protein
MSESKQPKPSQADGGKIRAKSEEPSRHQFTFETVGAEELDAVPDEAVGDAPSRILDPAPSAILRRQPSALVAAEAKPAPQSVPARPTFGGRDFTGVPPHTTGHPAVQPKLAVGPAGDRFEQEADRVAEEVLAMPALAFAPGAPAQPPAVRGRGGPPVQRARVDVATSVQADRATYPGPRGGLLTRALLTRLRNQRTTISGATAAVGAGQRRLGSAPGTVEERAGVSAGRSAAAAPGTTAQHRAVVIGNAVYNPGTTMGHTVEPSRPLPGSVTDATNIAAALRRRHYTVDFLLNQTAAQINAALTTALTGLIAGSELFFYYSGHGTPEGLIGVDGVAFTPAQMLAIRTTANTAQVNLVINTDACHSGIFADAIRGAALRDLRTSAAANPALVALLDAAIAVQDAKNTYNTAMQAWWARRYQLEAAMAASPSTSSGTTIDPREVAWSTHYDTAGTHWNNFVAQANPLLAALQAAAAAAGITLRPLTLTPAVTPPFDVAGEQLAQAGLDDVDTLTNEVIAAVDQQLP